MSTRSDRLEAFAIALERIEKRLFFLGISFERDQMPGLKRDFLIAVRKMSPALENLSESTFEEYMKSFGCKFPTGNSRSKFMPSRSIYLD